MTRLLSLLAAAVLATAFGTLLVGCGLSEAECQKACDRPYAAAEEEAAVRVGAWKKMPEPYRTQALAVYETWAAALKSERDTWNAQCVPQCRKGSAEVADCRRQAVNLAAWKQCQ